MRKGLMTLMLTTALMVPAIGASAAGKMTMKNLDVKAVQQILADGGFYRSTVDGVWGPQTAAALRSYQSSNGLQETGRLNVATAEEMGFTTPGIAARNEAEMNDLQNDIDEALNIDTRDHVIVHRTTSSDGIRYKDGRAIRDADGRVVAYDRDEASRLNDEVTPASGYAERRRMPGPVEFDAPRVDSSLTQAVQQALRDNGYYTKEPVNGLWTPYTANAVSSFQIDKGMRPTGMPDNETLARLGVQIPSSDKLVTGKRM